MDEHCANDSQEQAMETEDVIISNGPSSASDENIETDEAEGGEKDDEVACPLFMENLPRDFLSNPQLAAIASLLDSDDENKNDECTSRDACHSEHQCEDDKNDVDDNDTVVTTNRRIDKIMETTSPGTDNKPPRQFPMVGMVIGGGKVGRMHRAYSRRNRRPTSSSAPYPPQRQATIQNNRKKKTTIGEAQLFLNMWKL